MTESVGTPYPQLPGLDGYFLEDSYVVAIRMAADVIEFDLEVVLTPSHPDYTSPLPGEQHSYRRGRLSFPNPSHYRFFTSNFVVPAVDAAGERDLGNIDSLFLADGGYQMEGDWGFVEIVSDPLQMVLASEDIPEQPR